MIATDKFRDVENYQVFGNDDLSGAIAAIQKIHH